MACKMSTWIMPSEKMERFCFRLLRIFLLWLYMLGHISTVWYLRASMRHMLNNHGYKEGEGGEGGIYKKISLAKHEERNVSKSNIVLSKLRCVLIRNWDYTHRWLAIQLQFVVLDWYIPVIPVAYKHKATGLSGTLKISTSPDQTDLQAIPV